MRFLARIALSAAAFALGAVALRRWVEEQNVALVSEAAPASAPAPTQTPAGSDHTDPAYDSLSKEELYQRAQEAQIKGRSKMSKVELAEAVAQAELGGG
jgi:hypothetical protein